MTGVLICITAVIVLLYFTKIQALDIYRIVILLLLFSIVVGIHGLSHALLENQYGFVPFNLWTLPKKEMGCPCMKKHKMEM